MGDAVSGERVADSDDDREKPAGLAYSTGVRMMISKSWMMPDSNVEGGYGWMARFWAARVVPRTQTYQLL